MKKLILALSIILLNVSLGFAQNEKVVLCTDYDKTTGQPIGINKDWDIKKTGSYVYIVYSQDRAINESLTLQVDKKNAAGNFVFYARESFYNNISDKKKWAMYDYKFTSDGDYRVSVLGKNNVTLAKTMANIAYMSDEGTSNPSAITNSDYYASSTVAFGESVENAKLVGEASTFKLVNGSKHLVCLITNDSAFKTKSVTLYVYTGANYKEKAYQETFTVGDLDWDWIKVPVDATKVGKYVVDIYNDKDTFINSGYFEITR
ncbi:hypothetical protein ACQ33O_09300 [Ferruginibacter sp. SUN002]|uniref:hypothetical protein n=1 Tax=Ferruginibacter sp. SUN002 TaxID=2937789 RepID=UPI003D363C68